MRHNVDGRKLGRTKAHRKALYRNLVIALIAHERIRTTTPKAKEARRLAERMITFAKRGDLHARRRVASILNDKAAVKKLFDELGPRYRERPGGYTRVLKMGGQRHGDAAEMALLELVKDGDRPAGKKPKQAKAAKPKASKKGAEAKGEGKKAKSAPKDAGGGAKPAAAKTKAKSKAKTKAKSKAKSKSKAKAASKAKPKAKSKAKGSAKKD
jgi:large subunit ribosomal protein L17